MTTCDFQLGDRVRARARFTTPDSSFLPEGLAGTVEDIDPHFVESEWLVHVRWDAEMEHPILGRRTHTWVLASYLEPLSDEALSPYELPTPEDFALLYGGVTTDDKL